MTGPVSLPGFTLGELLDKTFPVPVPVLSPWLDERGLAMIHAAPGVGKSMLAMALAVAVAGGGGLLQWQAPKPRRVLYVDAEMTGPRLQERAAALLPSIDGGDAETARRNLRIIGKQDYREAEPFPLVGDEAGGSEVIAAWAEACQAELVVLDNVTTLAEIKDENNAAEIRPLTDFADRLRAAGSAVLLVHHNAKSGTRGNAYRGSTALDSPLEVRIGLERYPHPDGRGVAFALAFHKQRHRIDCEALTAWLEETAGGGRWCQGDAALASVDDDVFAMVVALKTNKYATQKELAEAIGVHPSKLARQGGLKAQAIERDLLKPGEMETILAAVKAERNAPDDY